MKVVDGDARRVRFTMSADDEIAVGNLEGRLVALTGCRRAVPPGDADEGCGRGHRRPGRRRPAAHDGAHRALPRRGRGDRRHPAAAAQADPPAHRRSRSTSSSTSSTTSRPARAPARRSEAAGNEPEGADHSACEPTETGEGGPLRGLEAIERCFAGAIPAVLVDRVGRRRAERDVDLAGAPRRRRARSRCRTSSCRRPAATSPRTHERACCSSTR